jgi:predicted  nucleic acid-binding Zn-ribbon protein
MNQGQADDRAKHEARLVQLEEHSMHAEHRTDQLHGSMLELHELLSRLEKKVSRLESRIDELSREGKGPENPVDENASEI